MPPPTILINYSEGNVGLLSQITEKIVHSIAQLRHLAHMRR